MINRIRTINQYQQLAARTLIDRPDFGIQDDQIMIAWNVIGLAGEATELYEVVMSITGHLPNDTESVKPSIKKELGDVMWYVAAICTKLKTSMYEAVISDFSRSGFERFNNQRNTLSLVMAAGNVCEMAKKGIFHQHGLDSKEIIGKLGYITSVVENLCRFYDFDFWDVLTANINKLIERYPDGYKSSDSIARVDVERD